MDNTKKMWMGFCVVERGKCMKDVNIYIYTEYSGSLKSGTGKYHVVLETIVKTNKGEEPATLKDMDVLEDITKNRLELLAVEKALSHLSKRSRVIVHTSSEYVTGAFVQGWPDKWKSNGFKTKGKPIKHADIWERVVEQVEKHDITFMKSEKTSYSRAQEIELKNFKRKEKSI